MSTTTPPDWYRWPTQAPTMLRYFDGARWTDHTAPLPPVQLAPRPVAVMAPQPRKYVTKGVSGTEHMVHVILCFLTFGLWIPVYLLRCLAGRHRTVAKF